MIQGVNIRRSISRQESRSKAEVQEPEAEHIEAKVSVSVSEIEQK
jgi:hypothetical protein